MQELPKILKHEQEKQEAIDKAREEAQEEIERKQQELAGELEKESFLPDEEKQRIFAYKKEKIAQIEKSAKQMLEQAIKELGKKQEENFAKAVDFVVNQSMGA